MNGEKRKILVPIFNRAHYGRLRSVLNAVKNHPQLELQVMIAVPAAYDSLWSVIKHSRPRSWRISLPWYIRARLVSLLGLNDRIINNDFIASHLTKDGFEIKSKIPFFIDGSVSETMAKSVGFGILKLVDELKRLKPDIVFVNADRFEMMALAVAASCLNIPIAHNEAGDVSGTLDESVRHAITKLAHIHFSSTKESQRRVLQMGENTEFVFNVGSPAIDAVKEIVEKNNSFGISDFGLEGERYLLVLIHPVATDSSDMNAEMSRNLIEAIDNLKIRTIFLSSNIDAGADAVAREILAWKKSKNPKFVSFVKNLPPDEFYKLLSQAACAVGNSSSFIREGAYFGTPAVLVGSRQFKRERAENIIEVDYVCEEIKTAILNQLAKGRYKPSFMFGTGNSGGKIASILATINPNIQKSFVDL